YSIFYGRFHVLSPRPGLFSTAECKISIPHVNGTRFCLLYYNKVKNMETIIGIAAGILTSVSVVPQFIKVLKEKEVETLAPLMVGILLTGVSMWVVSGVMLGDLPIIVSNAFSVFVNATLLMCYF